VQKNLKVISIIFVVFMIICCSTKTKTANIETKDDSMKILDEHVATMAKSLGKDLKSYRMLIRTDIDVAKIYRQIGRYIIVDSNGEVIYVPDRI
jgi:hypothetical protein